MKANQATTTIAVPIRIRRRRWLLPPGDAPDGLRGDGRGDGLDGRGDERGDQKREPLRVRVSTS